MAEHASIHKTLQNHKKKGEREGEGGREREEKIKKLFPSDGGTCLIPAFWGETGIAIGSARSAWDTHKTLLEKVNHHQQQKKIGLLSPLSWSL